MIMRMIWSIGAREKGEWGEEGCETENERGTRRAREDLGFMI